MKLPNLKGIADLAKGILQIAGVAFFAKALVAFQYGVDSNRCIFYLLCGLFLYVVGIGKPQTVEIHLDNSNVKLNINPIERKENVSSSK